jgi:hypothetical protein
MLILHQDYESCRILNSLDIYHYGMILSLFILMMTFIIMIIMIYIKLYFVYELNGIYYILFIFQVLIIRVCILNFVIKYIYK